MIRKMGLGGEDCPRVDLADGHVAALKKIVKENGKCGKIVVNLGTGKSTSVLELVAAFEKAAGKKIPMKMVARRPGDAAEVYAKTDLAYEILGWRASGRLRSVAWISGIGRARTRTGIAAKKIEYSKRII